ncbi:hypothetical protein QYM36_010677, partial [Artemia franciscana]
KIRKMNDLVWGIKNGDSDQVKEAILTKGINVNQKFDGRPLLVFAADYGHADILEFLLSRGASIDEKDKHGITALLAAIWEGHTACVKLLLEKGASRTGTTPDGTSYFDAAEKDEIKALLK